MGIFAPLVFVVRNIEAMDYSEYVRNRYNNMYVNGNPYGGAYNRPPQAPPTPFEEFAEKGEVDPGDPFAEFGSKKNNDREDI